ncbi:MAG: thioredoxin family protein [Bacteroidales bacterium]|jgi:thioredoxin-related protein
MKKLCFIILLLIIVSAQAQYVPNQTSLKQLLDDSKKYDKNIMLFMHFKGCSACVKMEKEIINEKEVSEFLSENFIYYPVDVREGTGIEINKIFNMNALPTIIILDSASNIIGKTSGKIDNKSDFLDFCVNSIGDTTSLYAQKQRYDNGYRNKDFLFKYCTDLYYADMPDSSVYNAYLSMLSKDEYTLKRNIDLIYNNSIVRLKVYLPYNSPFINFMSDNKELFYQYFDTIQVNSRITYLNVHAIKHSLKKGDYEIAKNKLSVLNQYKTSDFFRINDANFASNSAFFYSPTQHQIYEIIYYCCTDNHDEYNKSVKKFISENNNNPDNLHFLVSFFKYYINDPNKLVDAEKWIERSIELDDSYRNNNTYAWLLFKEKKYKEAMNYIVKAVNIATKNNEDFSDSEKLVSEIRKIENK